MKVTELEDKRRQLQKDLTRLIQEFEGETGVGVDIFPQQTMTLDGIKSTNLVEVELTGTIDKRVHGEPND